MTPAIEAAQQPSPFPEESTEQEDARLYRTNAERREVGLKHQITPWLTVSGLLELDGMREEFDLFGSGEQDIERETAANIQLGLVATPWEHVTAELVVEYDTSVDGIYTEEAIVGLEMDPVELEAGMMYLPFGVYINHFATGPLLEFGETRAPAGKLSYAPYDRLDISMSLYKGRTRNLETGAGRLNWVFSLETWIDESWSLGMSYQSNLADSDELLLADQDNRYISKAPGLSGYLVWTNPSFEVTLEGLGATSPLLGLPEYADKPVAWNLEFVHFLRLDLEWALRLEGSHELVDAPEQQYGAAVTWRIGRRASLTLEYLRGRFAKPPEQDEEEEDWFQHVNHYGVQLSVAF